MIIGQLQSNCPTSEDGLGAFFFLMGKNLTAASEQEGKTGCLRHRPVLGVFEAYFKTVHQRVLAALRRRNAFPPPHYPQKVFRGLAGKEKKTLEDADGTLDERLRERVNRNPFHIVEDQNGKPTYAIEKVRIIPKVNILFVNDEESFVPAKAPHAIPESIPENFAATCRDDFILLCSTIVDVLSFVPARCPAIGAWIQEKRGAKECTIPRQKLEEVSLSLSHAMQNTPYRSPEDFFCTMEEKIIHLVPDFFRSFYGPFYRDTESELINFAERWYDDFSLFDRFRDIEEQSGICNPQANSPRLEDSLDPFQQALCGVDPLCSYAIKSMKRMKGRLTNEVVALHRLERPFFFYGDEAEKIEGPRKGKAQIEKTPKKPKPAKAEKTPPKPSLAQLQSPEPEKPTKPPERVLNDKEKEHVRAHLRTHLTLAPFLELGIQAKDFPDLVRDAKSDQEAFELYFGALFEPLRTSTEDQALIDAFQSYFLELLTAVAIQFEKQLAPPRTLTPHEISFVRSAVSFFIRNLPLDLGPSAKLLRRLEAEPNNAFTFTTFLQDMVNKLNAHFYPSTEGRTTDDIQGVVFTAIREIDRDGLKTYRTRIVHISEVPRPDFERVLEDSIDAVLS